MNFNKYSKEQLGEAYKQIVGYNPFEDDADISKEDVIELMKGYDQAIAEEGSFGDTTFEQYFSSIKDENPVGKKAAIVAEKIIKKDSDSSAVKKYKDDLLKKSSLIFDIVSETIGTFTLKHDKTEIRVPRDLVLVLNDQPGNVSNKGGHVYRIGEKWNDAGNNFDYAGMLKMAQKIDNTWPADKIEKLFSSFEDVNYHDLGAPIWVMYLKKQENPDADISKEIKLLKKSIDNDTDPRHNEDYPEISPSLVYINDKYYGKLGLYLNLHPDISISKEDLDFIIKKGESYSREKIKVSSLPGIEINVSLNYAKGGSTPDSILDSSGEPSITAIQQQYYHRVSKALKSIAPNLELWKNFSIRDKDTNLVYRVDSFLFKRVGGKLQEIVFNYVHGQSSASIGELSIVFSSDEINANFESLGISKTEKFAWGGMAEKGGRIKDNVMQYGESIAEELIKNYLPDVKPNEVSQPSQFIEKGQYCLYEEKSKDFSDQCCIEVFCGDDYTKLSNAINSNYETFSSFLEKIAGRKNFNSEILTSDENETITFVLTNPRTSKFAWGGMAANVIGEKRARDIAKYFCEAAEKAGKEQEVVSLCKFAKDGFSVDLVLPCKEELNHITFRVALEDILRLRYYFDQFIPSKEQAELMKKNPDKFSEGGISKENAASLALMVKAQRIVDYTNRRLENWYKTIKEDYNVEGHGKAKFDKSRNAIVIDFTENGNNYTHEELYWQDEAIDYTFDVWMDSTDFAKGGNVSNAKLIIRPEYKYQNIAKRWLEDNKPDSYSYKLAILLLKNENRAFKKLGLDVENSDKEFDRYANLLKKLCRITESDHEMKLRTDNYSLHELKEWAKQKLNEMFILSDSFAKGGNISNAKLIIRPEYKYQKIAKSWLEDNDENSLRYKIAVMLLNNEHNIDEKMNININLDKDYDRYLRILRSLASITESKHEMSFRTNNVSIANAEKWAKEKLNEIFVLSDSYATGGLTDIFDKTIGQALYFLETEKGFSLREVKSRTRQDRKYDVFDSDSKFVKTLSRNEVVDFAKEQGFKFEHGGKVKKHDIYNDTPLAPAIIADYVAKDSFEKNAKTKNLPLDDKRYNLEQQLSSYLDERAIQVYKHNEHFRKQINQSGNKGRDKLYSFMYHWAEAWIGSLDKNFKPSSKYQDGGSVSVQPGDRVAFKDTGSIVRIDRESGDLMVRDASGNTQSIPKSRILEKFKYGGISRK